MDGKKDYVGDKWVSRISSGTDWLGVLVGIKWFFGGSLSIWVFRALGNVGTGN